MANKFIPHLKIIKNCVGKGNDYTQKNCSPTLYDRNMYASVVLENGTTLIFRNYSSGCNNNYGEVTNVCGRIIADINGLQGPNKEGYDIFTFYYTKDRIVPTGVKGASVTFERNCDLIGANKDTNFDKMYACTAWVIYNENMDYLHCKDQLGWDKNLKCK
jgi:hypothetical protein